MIKVAIIESERGWGQRIDDVKEFETRVEAEAFVEAFNAQNNEETVPDWYMYARIMGTPVDLATLETDGRTH